MNTYSYNNVDKYKLRHKNEDHEENRCYDGGNAAVPHTVYRTVTVFTKSVLHNSIPIVTCGHSEQGEECHAKVRKVGMFTKPCERC